MEDDLRQKSKKNDDLFYNNVKNKLLGSPMEEDSSKDLDLEFLEKELDEDILAEPVVELDLPELEEIQNC